MLSVEAEFPNPGARALLIEGPIAHPVRIRQHVQGRARGDNRIVIVTLLDKEGFPSSGSKQVRIAELADANPLSEAEAAELAALEAALAGKAANERSARYKRYMALFLRAQAAARAAELERLKGREPRQLPWSGRGRG